MKTASMDMRVDLHLHTMASDGCWSPMQLIDEVRRASIDLFGITDHDSLGSLEETASLLRGTGLRFLPGVEISSRLNGQLFHLLAYGFDLRHPELVAVVEENNTRLNDGNDETIRLLIEAGYSISFEEYAAYTWDRRRGGWRSLNFLIDGGYCVDANDYFQRLLAGIAHPEPDYPCPEEVVGVVQRAGGMVILAHPGAPSYNGLDTRRLDELVEMGVAGLECFSFHHDQASTQRFLEYCGTHNLLITGGSDCHGGFVGRSLGVPPVRMRDLRLDGLEEAMVR